MMRVMLTWFLRLMDVARDFVRRRSWTPEHARGRRAEDLVHRYLERHGYTVVARNYRPPAGGGEIDLVAWENGTLVFVEVKARSSDEHGAPERDVDAIKSTSLARAGRDYARRAGVDWERVRFDLVTVLLGRPPHLEHTRDAFRLLRTL